MWFIFYVAILVLWWRFLPLCDVAIFANFFAVVRTFCRTLGGKQNSGVRQKVRTTTKKSQKLQPPTELGTVIASENCADFYSWRKNIFNKTSFRDTFRENCHICGKMRVSNILPLFFLHIWSFTNNRCVTKRPTFYTSQKKEKIINNAYLKPTCIGDHVN